jgi:hypothetical protein
VSAVVDAEGIGVEGVFLIIPVIVVAIVIRLAAGGMDRGRIAKYIEDQEGQVLELRWSPLGPGWFGSRDRIYRVRYVDRDGNEHAAHCKTTLTTGVYFTEDRVVRYAALPDAALDDVVALETENRRLHEELARLRHDQGRQ